MKEKLGIDQITPEMARAELARREAARSELARRLNETSTTPYKDSSFLDKLPANIAAGLGQLGHTLLNEPHKEWNMVAPEIAKYIPQQENHDYSKLLGLPGTPADKIVQGVVSNAPFLMSPEAKLGQVGELIGAIPKAGNYLSGALSRAIPQAGSGMLLEQEDPSKGAIKGAGTQLALEALTSPIKSLKPLAELFNPVKAAEDELGKIRKTYHASESAKNDAYKHFNEISKEHSLENPKNYTEALEDYQQYFTPKIKQLNREFEKDPTLDRAHKLQSQMFSDVKKLSKREPDAATIDKIQGIDYLRDALNKDLISKLNKIDKNVATKYKEGARIHKEEISPYFSNSKLANLVEGDVSDITPHDLVNAIKPSKETKQIPKDHYLREALENMQSKLRKGQAAQFAIPMLAGGLGSQLVHPGLASLGAGLGAGALGGLTSPKLAEFIQNPEVEKLFERLKGAKKVASPAYYGGGRELSKSLF